MFGHLNIWLWIGLKAKRPIYNKSREKSGIEEGIILFTDQIVMDIESKPQVTV